MVAKNIVVMLPCYFIMRIEFYCKIQCGYPTNFKPSDIFSKGKKRLLNAFNTFSNRVEILLKEDISTFSRG